MKRLTRWLRRRRADDCPHIATCTDRIMAVFGPWVHVTEPVTICVTCRKIVQLPEEARP